MRAWKNTPLRVLSESVIGKKTAHLRRFFIQGYSARSPGLHKLLGGRNRRAWRPCRTGCIPIALAYSSVTAAPPTMILLLRRFRGRARSRRAFTCRGGQQRRKADDVGVFSLCRLDDTLRRDVLAQVVHRETVAFEQHAQNDVFPLCRDVALHGYTTVPGCALRLRHAASQLEQDERRLHGLCASHELGEEIRASLEQVPDFAGARG